MSGHSHSANIKRDKEKTDAKKGANFSKIARQISIAVKNGGGITDADQNFRLRIALEKAREVNMPKDNINRAIERGAGKGGEGELETIIYEGYGPNGIAVIVECITDNKNRTGAEIKNLFSQAGGNFAEPGAAAHYFNRLGMLKIAKEAESQDQILKLIDIGALDVDETGESLTVWVKSDLLTEFRQKAITANFNILETELVMKPINNIQLDDSGKSRIIKFVENLKAHDDVLKVFVNTDL